MKDSLSLTNGDLTGLTFCGARIFSIISPVTIPTWLAIGASTGIITLAPTDPALGGTTVSVTIKGYLATYPAITATTSFTVNFTSCKNTVPSFPTVSA